VIPHRIDIAERPAIVATKSRLGDWEGDTIVGAHHKGALLTHVERKSLFTTISKLSRPTAQATHRATVHRLNPLRDHVHTITYDNVLHQEVKTAELAHFSRATLRAAI